MDASAPNRGGQQARHAPDITKDVASTNINENTPSAHVYVGPPQPPPAPFQQGYDFAGTFSFQEKGSSESSWSKKSGDFTGTCTMFGKDNVSQEGNSRITDATLSLFTSFTVLNKCLK